MAITRFRRALIPVPFNKELGAAAVPENLVLIPAGRIGVRLQLTVDKEDAVFGFDVNASPAGLLVKKEGTYSGEVYVRTRISFDGLEAGKRPIVYGVIWLE